MSFIYSVLIVSLCVQSAGNLSVFRCVCSPTIAITFAVARLAIAHRTIGGRSGRISPVWCYEVIGLSEEPAYVPKPSYIYWGRGAPVTEVIN